MYSSMAEETFLLLLFFFFSFPWSLCHSQSPSGHVGLRNKRNEAGAVGKGLDSTCGDIAE